MAVQFLLITPLRQGITPLRQVITPLRQPTMLLRQPTALLLLLPCASSLSKIIAEPAQYDFNYAVNHDYSNNDYGHQENRNGYDTQGSYHVLLPDGRVQRVTYTVNGDSGYVAQVTYEGEAQYGTYRPSTSYQPAPAYA
nr:pro-resilin-like [Penaeus vannamei]